MSIEGYQNTVEKNENKNIFEKCPQCGEKNEVSNSFCWRCGYNLTNTSKSSQQNTTQPELNQVKEQVTPTPEVTMPVHYAVSSTMFGEEKYSQKNGMSALITTKDWLKVFCLGFLAVIPFVGPLVFFIISIVFAVKSDVAKSIQNYFRAQLIYSLIVTGLCIILFIIGFSIIAVSLNSWNYDIEPAEIAGSDTSAFI